MSDKIKHIRNVGAEDLKEPEGFASGDMKKFLENPDVEDEGDDSNGKE